jgi:hypothetical protein
LCCLSQGKVLPLLLLLLCMLHRLQLMLYVL